MNNKYLIMINTAQVKAIMPIDHNLFSVLHFEKLGADNYLLCYQGPRELVITKQNDLEVLLEETKLEAM